MIVLLAVVGCSDDGSDGESTTLDDLRNATSTCPIKFDTSALPSGLIGKDSSVVRTRRNLIGDEVLVELNCEFARIGGGTPDRAPSISVQISAVPADSTNSPLTDRILTQTGVDGAELQRTVKGLSVDEVAVLEGLAALAVRRVEIEGASGALMFAYGFGVPEKTRGEFEAIVSAATI